MFFFLRKLFLPISEFLHRNHAVIIMPETDGFRIIIQTDAGILAYIKPTEDNFLFGAPSMDIDRESLEIMRRGIEENLASELFPIGVKLHDDQEYWLPCWSFRRLLDLISLFNDPKRVFRYDEDGSLTIDIEATESLMKEEQLQNLINSGENDILPTEDVNIEDVNLNFNDPSNGKKDD